MQVARNFFLTREKTVTRKLREVLLAWKIEANLGKDEILQLYVNQIFLGQRAYGFAAASQIYFGKPLKDVTPAEAAMLAGLPKAPSAFNPVSNPRRAKTRQLYVLRRMHELRFINDDQFREAQSAPLAVRAGIARDDPYPCRIRRRDGAAGRVRRLRRGRLHQGTDRLHDDPQGRPGGRLCRAAARGDRLRPPSRLPRARGVHQPAGRRRPNATRSLERVFQDAPDSDGLIPAVVVEATADRGQGRLADGETIQITGDGLKFAAPSLRDKSPAATRIRPGAVIRVDARRQGPLGHRAGPAGRIGVRVDAPHRTARSCRSIGGFDFDRSKFNHVTQAQRQPGSSFKPFIYSAALEKGFTPATVVNDAPFFVPAAQAGGEDWEPKNYDGKFEGPMRVRAALAKSKNLVTVRVLQAIGPQYAQDYIARFGFDPKLHPPYLTMGLGAGSATPLQMVDAYAVFANGGYRVAPYLIAKIVDARGNVLSEAAPAVAREGAERAIDPRNAWIMTSLLKDVVRVGTATRALSLNRTDLAGKTGTTNEFVDAWFCGYNAALVAVAWIGFDQPKTLGSERNRRASRAPDLDFVHGEGAQGNARPPKYRCPTASSR